MTRHSVQKCTCIGKFTDSTVKKFIGSLFSPKTNKENDDTFQELIFINIIEYDLC